MVSQGGGATYKPTPKRVLGFTLAEVLITLGIIGIVAAMTMPTLINATNGVQYKTAFKKALSVMSQAIAMNIALNDYDLSETIAGTNPEAGKNGEVLDREAQTIYSIFRKRLSIARVASGSDFSINIKDKNYYPMIVTEADAVDLIMFLINHNSVVINGQILGAAAPIVNEPAPVSSDEEVSFGSSNTFLEAWGDELTFLFANDGMAIIFDNRQHSCSQATANLRDHYCSGYIDVNGQKGPNKVVACDNGSQKGTPGSDDYSCTVSNPTDIYPIAMYNQTIIPASAAARAVLFSK